MALLTVNDVRAAAKIETARSHLTVEKSLQEARNVGKESFDVFLSHAKLDAELVLGVKVILEQRGQTVYIDWIDDPHLDRSQVSPKTADGLRTRMRQCASLIYVYTRSASTSRWMPWELGYFDAFNGNVAVLPIVQSNSESAYKGEEFLGLYPYIDVGNTLVWVHRSAGEYSDIREWRTSSNKLRPAI